MKTIAIIDDDIHIGDMLTEVLMREGYRVLRAYSAQKPYIFSHKTSQISFCWI